ncbi:hypothetical protein S83_014980 [Arachis hypogaea]
MGCCISKSQTQNQNLYHQNNQTFQQYLTLSLPNSNLNQQIPQRQPPPVLEEEFVKEVLSQTLIVKRNQVPILKPKSNTLLPPLQNPDDKLELKNPHPIPNPIIINKKEGEVSKVVSQLSEEPCSISGSFSTTTTVTEKREEEVTSKRSIREGTTTMMKNHKWNSNRSPSRKRPHGEVLELVRLRELVPTWTYHRRNPLAQSHAHYRRALLGPPFPPFCSPHLRGLRPNGALFCLQHHPRCLLLRQGDLGFQRRDRRRGFDCNLPWVILRSVAGSYDNEGVSIFAFLLTFYLFVKVVNIGSLAWALTSTFGYFYMVSAWGGYVFIINLVPLYLLVLLVTGVL